MAIAWLYREDYARAEYRVLPSGKFFFWQTLLPAAALIPCSMSLLTTPVVVAIVAMVGLGVVLLERSIGVSQVEIRRPPNIIGLRNLPAADLHLGADRQTFMNDTLPVIYIARHGETAWTITGQHTGLTDLPLTAKGERDARALGDRLSGIAFAKVLTSSLQRATKTCALAGFESMAEVKHDLVEWNYGQYEALKTAEIQAMHPGWDLFRDGAPGGESPIQVMARADRVWKRVREVKGNVLLFTSGHFIRVRAARWIGLEPSVHSMSFLLSPASLSAVGYDQTLSRPVIRLWNDTHHVGG